MPNVRRVAIPGYLVAAILLLFPLQDVILAVLPLRFGEVAWRFGAAGLFSRALMTPILGLLLAFTVALLLEQRHVLRVFSVLTGLLSVVLLGTIALFVLDAVQMRAQIRPEAMGAFQVASLAALSKYGLCLVVTLAFAIAGWKATRGSAPTRRGRREASAVPLIHTSGRPVPTSSAAPTAP